MMAPDNRKLFCHEEQFRLLVDSVKDYAIFMLDPNGFILTWNSGAERIKGFTSEEIVGEHFAMLYPISDRVQGKPDQSLAMAKQLGRYEEEGWRLRRNGELFWARVTLTTICDDSGKFIGFSKVTRDLSETRNYEEQLLRYQTQLEESVQQKSRELSFANQNLQTRDDAYQLMVDSVADHAIFTVSKEDKITSWNDNAAKMYGYEATEILGQDRAVLFSQSDVEVGVPKYQLKTALAEGKSTEEGWRVRKDGSLFWAIGTIAPLFNAQSDLIGFVKIVRDLTEKKNADSKVATLLEELQLRDRAICAAPIGIVIYRVVQKSPNLVYVSPGFETVTGYTGRDLFDQSFNLFTTRSEYREKLLALDESVRLPRQWSCQLPAKRKNGEEYWLSCEILPASNGGVSHSKGENFVVVLFSDVTQRKNVEDMLRQSQKMEAVGLLAGGIAHDFNNSLSIILSHCEFLFSDLEDKAHKDSVAAISSAVSQATELTSQLLSISRKQTQFPTPVNLNNVVFDTYNMLRRLLPEKVELKIELDRSIGKSTLDSTQVSQVLVNLILNAKDAMPDGGTIKIQTQAIEFTDCYCNTFVNIPAGRYILLSVSDNGEGIPDEIHSRIFDPFFTTKGAGKGTGLGLAIVHGIVQQSMGHIGAYSEIGKGTDFRIYFPLDDEQLTSTTSDKMVQHSPSRSTKILAFSFNSSLQRMLAATLSIPGFQILFATDRDSARQLLQEHGDIELLLLDIANSQMLSLLGDEELVPSGNKAKILVLTGLPSLHENFPHLCFLNKPFAGAELILRIRELLARPR